jgi:hypothetical protein
MPHTGYLEVFAPFRLVGFLLNSRRRASKIAAWIRTYANQCRKWCGEAISESTEGWSAAVRYCLGEHEVWPRFYPGKINAGSLAG